MQQGEKERNKVSSGWKVLVSNDITVYIESPLGATRELLELTNEFNKVAGKKDRYIKIHYIFIQ